MIFNRLTLLQFRNIEKQELSFNPGLNILRGQNGQGKTNLIEAIYILTQGRSFRTSEVKALVNNQFGNGFFIDSQIRKSDLTHQLQIRVQGQRKELNLNQKRVSAPSLRRNFSSILFSPESLLIVKQSAQQRRDLIDELCSSLFPNFIKIHTQYRRLMKQKNNLLKQVRDGEIQDKMGKDLLKNLTQQLFEVGSQLTGARLRAIAEIEPFLLQEFLKIMDEHFGNLGVEYRISGQKIETISEEEILNAMYKRWEELKARELASGLALVGPHKHEIEFLFNGQQARFFCSQGQQRAIVLAFKMAQVRLHYRAHRDYPILLLDDVLSELDQEKQTRLLSYLLGTDAQVFLTTTDAAVLPQGVEASVFDVKDGVFSASEGLVTGGLSV